MNNRTVLVTGANRGNGLQFVRAFIAENWQIIACCRDPGSGGAYFYRSSKSALNQVVKSLSIDLEDRGISVVVFHPG